MSRTPPPATGEHHEAQAGPWAKESQQALLLELLRGGETISFVELQSAGIEFPASVVAELELAGAPLRRASVRGAEGLRRPGVRLDAEATLEHSGALDETTAVLPRQPQRERTARRLLALLPLLALIAVIAVVTIGSSSGGGARAGTRIADATRHASTRSTPSSHRAASPASPKQPSAATPSQPAQPAQTQPATTPVPPSASAPAAAQLEASGHQLLESGAYAQAVPTLERALAATGRKLGECLQPASEACLIYAYALYDLGDALMLDGRAGSAVPLLQERLEIDNQRPVVAAVLARARAQAGG